MYPTLPVSTEKKKRYTPSAEDIRLMKIAATRIKNIEEKSDCGSVRFLDSVADIMAKFAKWQLRLSEKVRGVTAKIDAPCSVSFGKSYQDSVLSNNYQAKISEARNRKLL